MIQDHTSTAQDKNFLYGDYLNLEKILSAQKPISTAHDEMMFIIQHHVSELWMKLVIYELSAVRRYLITDELPLATKSLARILRILEQLIAAWDVMRTMPPPDYLTFRDALGGASGLQSWQYREIEYLVGNKRASVPAVKRYSTAVQDNLARLRCESSVYDEAIRLLARQGMTIDSCMLERDWSQPYTTNDSVRAAWRTIYLQPQDYWPLYELAEKLVDFEDLLRRWRFSHLTTVERVIGFKKGTGGTAGVAYLKQVLDTVLFPELWALRLEL